MLNFSRRTPTLWKCFRWDSQKVGKIAHLGIFRHIGGSGVTEKLLTSKTSNIAISGPPRAEKWVFQTKHWHVRLTVHPNVDNEYEYEHLRLDLRYNLNLKSSIGCWQMGGYINRAATTFIMKKVWLYDTYILYIT